MPGAPPDDPSSRMKKGLSEFERAEPAAEHGGAPLPGRSEVASLAVEGAALPRRRTIPAWVDNARVNVALFLATLFSTTYAGVDLVLQDDLHRGFAEHLRLLPIGLPFSLSLLGILLSHELGHYFVGRRHGVRVTLPFFVPVPGFIGTMGAVILMRSPVRTRRALLDIGAAGPLAGMAVAIPLMVLGLHFSHLAPLRIEPGIGMGESLLVALLERLFAPEVPKGMMLVPHPLFIAAWFGCLVTAINLLPIGQLDGGHVAYAVLGRRQRRVALFFMGLLAVLAYWFYGWFIWLLILLLMGPAHPPVMDPEPQLAGLERGIALASLLIFVLTFLPVPFHIYG
jgi:membrane-associated protease RseP (regulator of RpoE activity)